MRLRCRDALFCSGGPVGRDAQRLLRIRPWRRPQGDGYSETGSATISVSDGSGGVMSTGAGSIEMIANRRVSS